MQILQASLNSEILKRYLNLFPDIQVNVLLSFALSKELYWFGDVSRDRFGTLVLDSGTYSLNNSKRSIRLEDTLESYCKYLQEYEGSFNYYINYDEDFTSAGFNVNHANQQYLEAHGLRPVPVVHDIHSNEVDVYLEEGHEIIAIGSSEGSHPNVLRPIVTKIHRADKKVHVMGSAGVNLLLEHPIDYCDTSSWAQRGAYGYVVMWDALCDQEDKTVQEHVDNLIISPHRDIFEDHLWDNFRMKPEDVQGVNYLNRQLVNLHYYVELERALNEYHGINQE
ncbi:hypothetical protein KAR91_22210 [Candidatus Pacearchaeota archaeon]|nr:hypothetical protein [Candidatus Pacearchaeota archaeon]